VVSFSPARIKIRNKRRNLLAHRQLHCFKRRLVMTVRLHDPSRAMTIFGKLIKPGVFEVSLHTTADRGVPRNSSDEASRAGFSASLSMDFAPAEHISTTKTHFHVASSFSSAVAEPKPWSLANSHF